MKIDWVVVVKLVCVFGGSVGFCNLRSLMICYFNVNWKNFIVI